jgi:cGMP-dependent protein kinase 1
MAELHEFNRHSEDFDCLTARIIVRNKSKQEFEDIRHSLRENFLFREVESSALDHIINSMNYYILEKNEFVFQQGNPGFNMFFVASGMVDVLVNEALVKQLNRGDIFGELALIHESGRRATVKTSTKVRLWGLGREMFRSVLKKTNQFKYKENKDFLLSIEGFKDLKYIQIESLLSAAISETYEINEKVVSEGESTTEMYVIKEGYVNIFKGGEKIATLHKGDYFGEHSLIFGTVRTATVIAGMKTTVLCFTREVLTNSLGRHLEMVLFHSSIRIGLSKDPLFSILSPLQINKILPFLHIEEINTTIITKPSRTLTIVLKGVLRAIGSEDSWKSLECIRSSGLLSVTEDTLEVRGQDCTICSTSKENIEKALGMSLAKVIEYNQVLGLINQIYLFKYVPQAKVETLSTMVKLEIFEDGQVVFNEGEPGDYCYIIKSGVVEILKNGLQVNIVRKDGYFGERAILFSDPRAATARVVEKAELWLVGRNSFLSLLDPRLSSYLKNKIALQDTSIILNDLEVIQERGRGTFSSTFLVRHLITRMKYALKTIPKNYVQEYSLMEKFKRDKKIHLLCNFPFISTLVKAFAQHSFLFFLYEYIQGPLISQVIEANSALQMRQAHFYASCILLTLEYLHNKKIIHREITSESFIIDEFGYPILTHFTNATFIDDRTFTIVGVPYYLSPEIINGQGYTFFADLWSFGILIYEMLYGVVPFGNGKEDPYEIYQSILNEKHRYPVFIKESQKPKGIIEKLLEKDPVSRGNIDSIKAHQWFEGVVWDDLIGKQVVPDLVPTSKPREKKSQIAKVWETDEPSDSDWCKEFN